MATNNMLHHAQLGLVVVLCVLVISMNFQVAGAKCHPTMLVRNKKTANPPRLNSTLLAPDVRAAADLKTNVATFWYTIPRWNAVNYCKDYYNADSKMQKMIEVRGTSNPKVTSMVYLTSSSAACKSPSKINSKSLIQQSTLVIDKLTNAIVNCSPGETICYVYKLTKKASTQHHGRRIQGYCNSDGLACVRNDACCTKVCDFNTYKCYCKANGAGCDSFENCCSQYCDSSSNTCKDPPPPPGSDDCFPGDARLELADGRSIPFTQLALGDQIKVVSSSTGDVKVESALFWLHSNPNKHVPYLNIQAVNVKTNATSKIRISPAHFLPTSKGIGGEIPEFSKFFMAPAKDVKPGSWIWVKSSNETSDMSPARVTTITHELIKGVFSVMTDSGTVIVDGVAASSYADITMRDGALMCESFVSKKNIPAFQHALLAPVRLAAKMFGPKVMEALASSKSLGRDGSLVLSMGYGVRNVVSWAKNIYKYWPN